MPSALLVGFKNLLADKFRYILVICGIGFAVFLMAFFLSLYQGFNRDAGRYIADVDTDLWVIQEGTRSFFDVSVLPQALQPLITGDERIGELIESVSGLVARPITLNVDGQAWDVHIVGFDTSTNAGAPQVIRGAKQLQQGEIIIDEVLAKRAGIAIGDRVVLADEQFQVVGLSTGGNAVFSQLAFLTLPDAVRVAGLPQFVNFYLVRLRDPAQASLVGSFIEESIPGVAVLSRHDFVGNTRHDLTEDLLPLLTVIVIVGFVVGAAVAGLTIYTLIIERMREYGILKALGFSNPDLYLIVFQQSLIAGLLGFGLGLGYVALAVRLMDQWLPQFATLVRWQDLLGVFAAALVMSLIAAYVPVRRLAGLNPVIVFNP